MTIVVGMTQPTTLYRLVEAKLGGGTLVDYVVERRGSMSWRAMAADLSERTGEEVSYETLRNWFADRITTTVTITDPAGAA